MLSHTETLSFAVLYVIKCNDILKNNRPNIRLFADGTSENITVDDHVAAAELLNLDIYKISKCSKVGKV